MNDDARDIILQSLARIEGKLDAQVAELNSNAQRVAVLEAKASLQEKINARVEELSKQSNQGNGVKTFVAWLIATVIGLSSWFR